MATTLIARKAQDGRYGTAIVGEEVDILGWPFLGVYLTGVAVATANVQVTVDGTNWVTIGSVTAVSGTGAIAGVYPASKVRVASAGTVTKIQVCASRGS